MPPFDFDQESDYKRPSQARPAQERRPVSDNPAGTTPRSPQRPPMQRPANQPAAPRPRPPQGQPRQRPDGSRPSAVRPGSTSGQPGDVRRNAPASRPGAPRPGTAGVPRPAPQGSRPIGSRQMPNRSDPHVSNRPARPASSGGAYAAPSRRQKKDNNSILPRLGLILAAVILIIALGFGVRAILGHFKKADSDKPVKPTASETEATAPVSDGPYVVATASVGTQGDLLMHRPIILASALESGGYDFSSVFRYTKAYTQPLDYAIANLETTLAGEAFPYQGYPAHNCPDELADEAKAAGIDMLLTANNHCGDTHMEGIDRTLQQVRQRGISTLGTRLNQSEKRYEVVDVNGIRIGMVCYTYAMGIDGKGVCMNGADTYLKNPEQVNYFTENELEKLYSEVQSCFDGMKAEGADATMLFIHWGVEYELSENSVQRSIAQRMCDMGFDVIVGGHPHVIQPMDLLSSNTDPDHKTICIYSLGNAISNQFTDQMTNQKSGHTEDGMLFTVNFEKDSEGCTYVRTVDILPTWIIRTESGDKTEYSMVPLDEAKRDQWPTLFGLNGTQTTGASDSYNRTMTIVGPGLQKVNSYLSQINSSRSSAEGHDAA